MALRSGGRAAATLEDDDDDDFYSGGGSRLSASEQQRLLVREQDDTIKTLASSVERVHGLARVVNDELSSQNHLLEEMDVEVEKTDSRLKGLNTQLRKLANDSDRGKYCLIVFLLIVLAILTLMVLS